MEIDIRKFVPKEVYTQFKEESIWFVSDNIIKLYTFMDGWFSNYFKTQNSKIESVEIVVNNWHKGGDFNNRGLRTYEYIKSQITAGKPTAKLTQHLGGSTNAIDFNILLHFKDGTQSYVASDTIHDLITANPVIFMNAGLTTLEDKSITKGWTHADCRFTGLSTLLIVKP